ncbi:MAG: 3-deoxy-manno-octulosonate cytidylyltransferase [Cyanobacteria bacterium REEB67]|nr:3-deoxy-manno-octulosonate cytidylyltransferase [Cyanobacteria bacterium REEB67]
MSKTQAQTAIVIPARYASTRFPGKPLVKIGGVSMIERTYQQAMKAKLAQIVLVATDDERIAEAVRAFGGQVIMTGSDHPSGTDRLAEVARLRPEVDIIVNVQGDEPLIDPQAIDRVIEPLLSIGGQVEMSTLAYPLKKAEEIESPQVVKVVVGEDGFALYFSRLPIPYHRDQVEATNTVEGQRITPRDISTSNYLGHAGLYVYKRETLLKIATLPPGKLENREKLEQLRALENGIKIKVVVVDGAKRTPAVDIPEDVAIVESFLAELSSVS